MTTGPTSMKRFMKENLNFKISTEHLNMKSINTSISSKKLLMKGKTKLIERKQGQGLFLEE